MLTLKGAPTWAILQPVSLHSTPAMSASDVDTNDVCHPQETFLVSPISDSDTLLNSSRDSTLSDTVTAVTAPDFPAVIPLREEHEPRTLILCFDGTGDQFDMDVGNSNIVEFFTTLKKDDHDKQMVYYQAGIGTYTSPALATPLAANISKVLDEAIAWNLQSHVMDGYEFLMQNYKRGDRICIFGFSRGAYTARGLAGMIHKVGLLPTCNHQQVPFAYKMFTSVDEIGWRQSKAFKKTFSVDVPIEFLGLWDTVNSVGLFSRRLPFITANGIVRTLRHAVALDERRAKFKVTLWNRPHKSQPTFGVEEQEFESKEDHTEPKLVQDQPINMLKTMERQYSLKSWQETDIEEVWFAGCHCDVGGGSVENGTPYTLAKISLRWMIRECFKANTGIMFISDALHVIGLDIKSLHPKIQKRPPPLPVADALIQRIPRTRYKSELEHYDDIDNLEKINKTEEEHELQDAMAPIYDQLSLAWPWWLLELPPIKQHYDKSDGGWGKYYASNLGHGRFIPWQTKKVIKVHRSVKMRMGAQYADGERYIPQASFERALACGNIEWVD